jgi:DNA-binding response OmpR family regulator
MILRRHGYQVVPAASSEEALRYCLLHRGQVELVVSDIVMPRVTGPELRARLREQGSVTPFLFVSGYPHLVARHDVEAHEILDKPFRPDQLLTRVRNLLEGGA